MTSPGDDLAQTRTSPADAGIPREDAPVAPAASGPDQSTIADQPRDNDTQAAGQPDVQAAAAYLAAYRSSLQAESSFLPGQDLGQGGASGVSPEEARGGAHGSLGYDSSIPRPAGVPARDRDQPGTEATGPTMTGTTAPSPAAARPAADAAAQVGAQPADRGSTSVTAPPTRDHAAPAGSSSSPTILAEAASPRRLDAPAASRAPSRSDIPPVSPPLPATELKAPPIPDKPKTPDTDGNCGVVVSFGETIAWRQPITVSGTVGYNCVVGRNDKPHIEYLIGGSVTLGKDGSPTGGGLSAVPSWVIPLGDGTSVQAQASVNFGINPRMNSTFGLELDTNKSGGRNISSFNISVPALPMGHGRAVFFTIGTQF